MTIIKIVLNMLYTGMVIDHLNIQITNAVDKLIYVNILYKGIHLRIIYSAHVLYFEKLKLI